MEELAGLEAGFQIVTGTAELLLVFCFFHRFIGRRGTVWKGLFFLAAGVICILFWDVGALYKLFVISALLYVLGTAGKREQARAVLLYAVVTVAVMQFCYGIENALIGALSPYFYPLEPRLAGLSFMLGGEALALALSYGCFRIVEKYFLLEEPDGNEPVLIMLAPLLLILLVSEFIIHSVYGSVIELDSRGVLYPGLSHMRLLAIELLCMLALFSVLYAYRRLIMQFRLSARVAMLEQEARFQKQYVKEAKSRYDRTKAFRHDIRSHLAVLGGLLSEGKTGQAIGYLEGMGEIAQELSFPFRTQNVVLDILLANKLGAAGQEGIRTSCALKMPADCAVGDIDLCVLFSNALDNALKACGQMKEGREKYICIAGHMQGDYLFLEIENSCEDDQECRMGIGMYNMKAVVDNYGGTMDIKCGEGAFCLSVLLLISGRGGSIS